jgi:hypothetical protein
MKEIKKVIVLLLCLPLLLAMPVKAESADLDVSKKGSITISIPKELQETDVAFSLYQIASVTKNEDGSYSYTPISDFTDSFRISEENLETENFREYVSDYIEKNKVQPGTTSGLIKGKESFSFQDLSLGVYYVAETQLEKDGSYEMTPFVIAVPFVNDGVYVYDVDASTKYQFNTIAKEEPKQPSSDISLPKEAEPTTTITPTTTTSAPETKTPAKTQIPFSGTYMYLLPIFCGAGLFLLVIGYFLCFYGVKEL